MGAFFSLIGFAPLPLEQALDSIRTLESPEGDVVEVFVCPSGAILCYCGELIRDHEGIAAALSRDSGVPVIDLSFAEDVVWGYDLFQAGQKVDSYLSYPNYWGEEGAEGRIGDAATVAQVWPNLEVEAISAYFTEKGQSPEHGEGLKAYPDDQCVKGDGWQLCDFMRKLGLDYPIDKEGELTNEPVASFVITTAAGLAQKADFEARSKQIEEMMAQWRENNDP